MARVRTGTSLYVTHQTLAIRRWFCIAAALIAASIADPLMEFASNRGLFGPGSLTDHSNQDVFPALAVGLAFGAGYLVLRVRRLLARGETPLAVRVPAHSQPRPFLRLLPIVYVVQLMVLFAMETVEQVVVAGHPLGGTVWLGGPPVVSLAVHAACCGLTTLLLGSLLRELTRKAVNIVVAIVDAIGLASRSSHALFIRVLHRADARRRAPLLSRIGDRAPPLLAA